MNQSYGLKQKLRRVYLILGVLPLFVVMLLGIFSIYVQSNENANSKLKLNTKLLKNEIQKVFLRLKMDAFIIKSNSYIHEFGTYLNYIPTHELREIQQSIITNRYTYSGETGKKFQLLKGYINSGKYIDVYFIRKEDSQIRFSFNDTNSLGMNLDNLGEDYKNMNDVQKKTIRKNDIYISDMAFSPVLSESVIYVGIPCVSEGNVVGVYLFLFRSFIISEFFSDYSGLGDSGDSYIIGEDNLFRTNGRFVSNAILKKSVSTFNKNSLYKNEIEFEITKDYRNTSVMRAYAPVDLVNKFQVDFEWYILSEMDTVEALENLIIIAITLCATILILIIINIFYGTRFSGQIVTPITILSEISNKISKGDFNVKMPYNQDYFEIRQFSASFSNLVETLKGLSENLKQLALGNTNIDLHLESSHPMDISMKKMAQTIVDFSEKAHLVSSGNYDVEFEPRSEKDILGNSLKKMTESLKSNHLALMAGNWLKNARSKVAEIAQSSLDIEKLSFAYLLFFMEHTRAKSAVFYTLNEDSSKPVFELTSRYGVPDDFALKKNIPIDDGITGSLFRDNVSLRVINNLEENILKYGTGFGQFNARNILLIPFRKGTITLGVVELLFSEDIEDNILEMVIETSDIISSSLKTSLENKKIKLLLEKTTNQTEELQQQQEELRAVNEEMAEKNNILEKQKIEILKKNKELETVGQKLQAKAGELEKVNVYKSEFLANMSHELRTPLNSLLLLSGKLARNKERNLTEKQIEYLKVIHRSGDSLLVLINGLLDLAKIDAGRMEVSKIIFRIDAIAQEIESTFREGMQEKNLEFRISIDSALPPEIESDPQKMIQIIRNLVSNSMKFTTGGSVNIFFEHFQKDSIDYLLIRVKDTGIGIPEDKMDLIFEAFRQVDGSTARIYGGTGLGLTITREFTRQLGGYLQVESKENAGSEFKVFFPLGKLDLKIQTMEKKGQIKEIKSKEVGDMKLHQEEIGISADQENSDAKKVILIIEDDPAFSHILIDICREKNFHCLYASDGRQGLEIVQKQKVDAIILDLTLPGMNGEEVLEKLKSSDSTKNIPVQIISGASKAKAMMQKGAMGYLKKPASENDINEALENIQAIISVPLGNILVIEQNIDLQKKIRELFIHFEKIHFVENAFKALEKITQNNYSCIVIDYDIPELNAFEFFENIKKIKGKLLPVIIYTEKELSDDEQLKLNKFTSSIIIKSEESLGRLHDETMLFLNTFQEMPENLSHENDQTDDALAGCRILLIDDDMRNLFALTEELEEEKILVTRVSSGKKALEIIQSGESFDLVMSDIMMPEMDGYETIRNIRKISQYSHTPIIALTAKAMKEDRNLCIEAGATDYLAKPVDRDKMFSMIKFLIKKGVPNEKT